MIVSFSSFSLLATPVEMAASFARKKKTTTTKKTKETKEKKKKTMRMILDSSENLQKQTQTQFIRMGDYKLSVLVGSRNS